MKRTAALLTLLALCLSQSAIATPVRTKAYIKRDGSYVASSYRTAPNRTKADNYSTKGNYNPYTGKIGKKKP